MTRRLILDQAAFDAMAARLAEPKPIITPSDPRIPENIRHGVWIVESGCWLWTGSTNGRYGRIGRQYTHRISYEAAHGPIPKGLQIDHLCRTPLCANPNHLEAVTPRENVRRSNGISAVNGRRTACVNGHPFTAENTHVRPGGGRRCRQCNRDLYWSNRKARRQALHAARRASGIPVSPRTYDREVVFQVLDMLAAGSTPREVGQELGINTRSVGVIRTAQAYVDLRNEHAKQMAAHGCETAVTA